MRFIESASRRKNTITGSSFLSPAFPRAPLRHSPPRPIVIFRFPAGFPQPKARLSRGITRQHLADARVPSIAARRTFNNSTKLARVRSGTVRSETRQAEAAALRLCGRSDEISTDRLISQFRNVAKRTSEELSYKSLRRTRRFSIFRALLLLVPSPRSLFSLFSSLQLLVISPSLSVRPPVAVSTGR